METSIYLAKLMGPIYFVIGLGVLINPAYFRSVAREVAASPALLYLTAVFALVAGGLIVILNNVWSGWPIVITILGWLAILKGTVRILAPTRSTEMINRFIANPNFETATGLVALALGAYLTAMGFWLGPLG